MVMPLKLRSSHQVSHTVLFLSVPVVISVLTLPSKAVVQYTIYLVICSSLPSANNPVLSMP
jgi:hypothetical protein